MYLPTRPKAAEIPKYNTVMKEEPPRPVQDYPMAQCLFGQARRRATNQDFAKTIQIPVGPSD
jgi:hypothetical protein